MISVIQPEMFRLDAARFSHTKTPSSSVPKANKNRPAAASITQTHRLPAPITPKGENMKKYIIFSILLVVFAAATGIVSAEEYTVLVYRQRHF